MKDIPKDFATPEKQEARAFLRERFLRVITGITDKDCEIQLFDNTTASAKFGGCDLDAFQIFVKDLTQPSSQTAPHALIRTTDILSIEVPNATYQKLIDPTKEQNGTAMEVEAV
ncbi:gem-associated protein 7-like [Macrosteles quadrilineatus]|uniref:gem-associated protein 7-like n=1 Tax=Macrosteles quadrilineatus TaxID=74068 RepID=UPI0023E224DD|nr:gem-associated protein 7-like [Macrosteles quadrilineatus]XP_054269600.1 gem-associated protein 7-like [Macrosteles quadrilineatus]